MGLEYHVEAQQEDSPEQQSPAVVVASFSER